MAIKKDHVNCGNNQYDRNTKQYMKYISLNNIISYIDQKK